tara:strand:- start:32084 stop:33022 length:939 start_codon:yes stop_codon:yes gene_type:complete
MLQRLPIIAIAALSLWGCADEFSDYNQVDKLRVLAIRAEPPDLLFEDETTLEALVVGDDVASYEWSWCPFSFSDSFEGECPVPEEEFRQLVADLGGEEDPPPYLLGTGASQPYKNLIPPALLDLFCTQLGEIELPEGFEIPPCNGRFEISLRLAVQGQGGESIVTTTHLSLIYEDGLVPNQNPTITGGEMSVRGAPPFAFSEDTVTMVARDVEYAVDVVVPESSIETFPDEEAESGETLERLTMSWFYEAGSMDKSRSSYIDGFTDLANLGSNAYTTPSADELERDDTKLFFVLRDDRGGIGWFIAQLELSL